MLLQNANRTCVRELETAIAEFIRHSQPATQALCMGVWAKSADDMLNSIGRFASRTLAEHDANNI
jgi:hypothetical protein